MDTNCRRIVVHRPGDHRALRVESAPMPAPGPGEIRIATRAAGVNFADCIVRMGLYASANRLVGFPITPGFEVAGVVDAAPDPVADASGVRDEPRVGDRVLAVTLFGGYATHLVVPRAQAFPVPAGWSFEQAAAFPAVFLTAWYALFELAHPRPGQAALVHSAAGGVGQALVQLLKLAGCRVIGVVGATHKTDAVRALGADAVIDKSRVDLWAEAARLAPRGYDHAFDANGVETLAASYAHLAPMGKLVVYGFHSMFRKGRATPDWPKLAWDRLRTPRFDPLHMTQDNKSVLAFNLSFLGDRQALMSGALRELLGWVAAGRLRPPAVSPVPFERAADAHRALESGQSVGKLVLTVN
jgi:NADPH:quinone reductase-like Zn-dependent oxidoreductase